MQEEKYIKYNMLYQEKTYCYEDVLAALAPLRVPVVFEEYDIHQLIAARLDDAHIPYKREYRLGPRNRIDFFIPGGIGIEVKRDKPVRTKVIAQIKRYSSFDEIHAVILISERGLTIPEEFNGKPCVSVSLKRMWGVAI